MEKEIIHTKQGPPPAGAYSQAVKYGNLIFTAQLGPLDPDTGKLLAPGDIVEQTKITIQNLEKVLKEAGSSLEKVLKVTAYIDVNQWQAFNDTYAEYFPNKGLPARSIVGIIENNEMLVALDIIAYCED